MAAASTTLTFLATGNPTGLKFTVEHGGARCLFDFGLEHAPGGAPFGQGLRPRPGREVADLLAVGSAPRLDGVYDAWDGRTSVFISHLHLDHSSLVRHLHPAVPLHYPEAMESLRAACDAAAHPAWRRPPGIPLGDRERVQVGPIEVEAVAVDHDLPGATGYLIRTPDLTLAFTGDHRWHGLRPHLTAAFAAAARGADVLLQEAVGLSQEAPAAGAPETAPESEAEVGRRFEALLVQAPGLVVVNLYPMNRERVAGLAAACTRSGRRLLMAPGSALMAGWEDVYEDARPVRAGPGRHCLVLPFEALPELIDLEPPPGSLYVHSNGAPLGPYDPAFSVMQAWPRAFGMGLAVNGSTGHSYPADIVRMVGAIQPALLLPVHSRHPERLNVPGIRRLLPEANRPYRTAELRG